MSILFQNILVAVIGALALAFLIKKFVWNPKKKNNKSCGNNSCGC